MSKSKVQLFTTSFKCLGHHFMTEKNCTSIPPEKAQAFQQLRNPLSTAETISRLGSIAYFSSYVPLLRKITAPLQEMVKSGVFRWDRIHQESWESMKLLCGLQFTNSVIDQTKHLYIATDSSQIAIAFLCFQISDSGEMILIFTDCRILKQNDRNRAAAFRELLGLLFSVISLEDDIRMHQKQVILLTDAISLSLLHRQKFHNNWLLEISIFLGHFENLSIHYACGPSLFFADLISRQYKEVHLQNSPDLISKEWSELLPAMNLRNVGVTLTPEKLNDFLLSRPRKEILDCFWGSSFYKQNTTRYFNLKTEDLQKNCPSRNFLSR